MSSTTGATADAATGATQSWSRAKPYAIVGVLTLAALLPFMGKAFHIDDPLFVWSAKQIVKKPSDPYGFPVLWYTASMPMSEVMKNPPLAAYYAAAAGRIAGWSEYSLHLAFFLPALVVPLCVYRLATDLTRWPLVAAMLAAFSPAFLVSSTSIMSDVPMLALWMIAVLLWRSGLQRENSLSLAGAAVLMAGCALTKYFGACLIPLLLLYSVWKTKRLGGWALYLLIPVGILGGYQEWTRSLYGRGLLLDAAGYVTQFQAENPVSRWGVGVVALSFAGACCLPVLLATPWLWRKIWIGAAAAVGALAATSIARGWFNVGVSFPREHDAFLVFQLFLFVTGGISVLGMAAYDLWQRRDADSVFLAAWIGGTFLFAAYFNWTVNARSVLPMVPAAAILAARRLEASRGSVRSRGWILIGVCGLLGVWVAEGDAVLANSARQSAQLIYERRKDQPGQVIFSGHWGFQYYMQLLGGRALDLSHPEVMAQDLVVNPENNTNKVAIPAAMTDSAEVLELQNHSWVSTMEMDRSAGFYTSMWGVMPFVFGDVPVERYWLVRLRPSVLPLRPIK